MDLFKNNPSLVGVLIMEQGKCLGMIPREKCTEYLSRPYAIELFMNRSVTELYNFINIQPLWLAANTNIDTAVQAALNRPGNQTYDPIIIRYDSGKVGLLDCKKLLLAQSLSLENANRTIQHQVNLVQALAGTFDMNEILNHSLSHLNQIISYEQAAIFIEHQDELVDFFLKGLILADLDPYEIYTTFKASDFYVQLKSQTGCIYHTNPDFLARALKIRLRSENGLNWVIFPLHHSNVFLGWILLVFMTKQDPENLLFAPANANPANMDTPVWNSFLPTSPELLANFTNTISVSIRNAQLHSEAQKLARIDDLTNIYNRRGFFDIAQTKLDTARQRKSALAALMVDIDHFKQVNDQYGHLAGDHVIRCIAEECRKNIREIDLLGRYGGEEFIILLPESTSQTANMIGNRLIEKIAHRAIVYEGNVIKVTVSIGVALYDETWSSLDTLFQFADHALYQAKSNGRNRLHTWNPTTGFSVGNGIGVELLGSLPEGIHPGESGKDIRLYDEMIEGWVRALELRDKETEDHVHRVTKITLELAEAFQIPQEDLIYIRWGTLLHDIGKIAIPDTILFKPDKLTDEEWAVMRKHPVYARDLIQPYPFLHRAVEIPYYHHEKWDGSGYPEGLQGTDIPFAARLFAIVDVWDALRSDRCYRSAWKDEAVIDYLQEKSGTHFDPEVAAVFIAMIKKNNQKLANGASRTTSSQQPSQIVPFSSFISFNTSVSNPASSQ